MTAILIKAPITLRLQGDIWTFPLTKCPWKEEERQRWVFLGWDSAHSAKCVKISISRRNKDSYSHSYWRMKFKTSGGLIRVHILDFKVSPWRLQSENMVEHGKGETQQKCPSILKCQTNQAPLEACFHPLSFPMSCYQGSGCLRESSEWSHSCCQSRLKMKSSPSGNREGTPNHRTSSCIIAFSKLSHARSGRASLVTGSSKLSHPWDELWHDPEGPTGSIEGLVGCGCAQIPARDPRLLWLTGWNQNQPLLSSPACRIWAHCCRAGLPRTVPEVQTKFSEILSWITHSHSYSLAVISTQARPTLIKYLWHLGIEKFGLVLLKFAYLLGVLTYSDQVSLTSFPATGIEAYKQDIWKCSHKGTESIAETLEMKTPASIFEAHFKASNKKNTGDVLPSLTPQEVSVPRMLIRFEPVSKWIASITKIIYTNRTISICSEISPQR